MTPFVILDLVSKSATDRLSRRVDEVMAATGARRASWWDNVAPDRTDLPRTLDEFPTLVVYENDHPVETPAPPDGITSLAFGQARPGQGRLSGRPTIGLVLVLISPRHPEGAVALRDWGDFVHIREIAEADVPGYTMITPYERVDGEHPRFLHLYEIDDPDPEATLRAMTPLVTARIGTPETDEWKTWAFHPELRIMYVNSFRLAGERLP